MKLNPRFRAKRARQRRPAPQLPTLPQPFAPEAFGFGRLWNGQVLDRLQMPLTRFRD